MSLSSSQISYPFSITDLKVHFVRGQMINSKSNFIIFKVMACFRSRKKERDRMQPLSENSHNPLGQLSKSSRWLLTPSEIHGPHLFTTLWTRVSKGRTHGTRATCVAWFPTKGTEAPSSSTNLTSGRESKQTPSGTRETLHQAGECIFEWVWIPFKLSGARRTLHLAGNYTFEWVWIPFNLGGSRETPPPSWGVHLRMGLNPIQAKWRAWNSPLGWGMHLRMGLNPIQAKWSA